MPTGGRESVGGKGVGGGCGWPGERAREGARRGEQYRGSLWEADVALSTHVCAAVCRLAIFAYSLSLGLSVSLVLHRSDAVADAWLGSTELIW